jgi:hypothetical protein
MRRAATSQEMFEKVSEETPQLCVPHRNFRQRRWKDDTERHTHSSSYDSRHHQPGVSGLSDCATFTSAISTRGGTLPRRVRHVDAIRGRCSMGCVDERSSPVTLRVLKSVANPESMPGIVKLQAVSFKKNGHSATSPHSTTRPYPGHPSMYSRMW